MNNQNQITEYKRPVNIKQFFYYIDLICEKIDLQTDAFIKRIEAIKTGDWQKVEFIEEMMLKPLDTQIIYLANKTGNLFND